MSMIGAPQSAVISRLNPIVKGWTRYFNTGVSRKIFERLDHLMHLLLWEWATKRHAHKGQQWIKRKYFRKHGKNEWRFMTEDGKFLINRNDHKIVRHIKVKGEKSPFDGDYVYWANRMGKHPLLSPRKAELIRKQKGRCEICGNYFITDEVLEVHHIDGNHGNNKPNNVCLVHGHCHDQIHGSGLDKPRTVEEPYELKGSRTVLKPSSGGDTAA